MTSPDKAERKLAAMLLLECDIDIAPGTLGAFIRQNWSTVAPLAHIIHGRKRGVQDNTKPSPGGGVSDQWKGQNQ
jgi:hypothetical protein